MSNLKQELADLFQEIKIEDTASFDLWTWLPSFEEAKKHHGDDARDYKPLPKDIMTEATLYLAQLSGHQLSDIQKATWFVCPCGEYHNED